MKETPPMMSVYSKHTAKQIRLLTMYSYLENKVNQMKSDLQTHPRLMQREAYFELIHSNSEFNYQKKVQEVETLCIFYDVMTEYLGVDGSFIHVEEITISLTSLLKEFEQREAYEVCSIIKNWYDEIRKL